MRRNSTVGCLIALYLTILCPIVRAEEVPPLPMPGPVPTTTTTTSCPVQFDALVQAVGHASKISRVLQANAPSNLPGFVRSVRNGIQKFLQESAQRDYPIAALEDATPLKAHALANSAYGHPIPESLDIAQVQDEFRKILASVQSYPQRRLEFEEETLTIAARAEALEQALSSGLKGEGIGVPLPEVKIVDGKEQITLSEEPWYFANPTAMRNELTRLRKQLISRIGPDEVFAAESPGFISAAAFVPTRQTSAARTPLGPIIYPANETKRFALEHATQIKQLETLAHEILARRSLEKPGTPFPAELDELLRSVNDLYTAPNRAKLKEEFKPPRWAVESLKNHQLRAESVELRQKVTRVFAVTENPKLKPWLDYAKDLPEATQRNMGVHRYFDLVSRVMTPRRRQFLTAVSLIGTAGSSQPIFLAGVDLFTDMATQKEECAMSDGRDQYLDCAVNYMKIRFPLKYEQPLDRFMMKGDGVDPAVLAEVDNLAQRRIRYLREKKELAAKDARIRTLFHERTQDDEKLRIDAVQAETDEEFKTRLYGGSNTPSYFEMAYGPRYPEFKSDIDKIVEAPFDEQTRLLVTLRTKAPDIADDLDLLLLERDSFVAGRDPYSGGFGPVGPAGGGSNSGPFPSTGSRNGTSTNGRRNNNWDIPWGAVGPGFVYERETSQTKPTTTGGSTSQTPTAPVKTGNARLGTPATDRKVTFWEYAHRSDIPTGKFIKQLFE